MAKDEQDNMLPVKPQPRGESSCPNPRPSPVSGVSLPPSPFVKGISFNPGGQPKGKRVSTRMAEMMAYTAEELQAVLDDPKSEIRDLLAAKAIKRAMRAEDAHADMSLLMDRTEGKVAQELNVRAQAAPSLTDAQLAGIAAGTLDPATLVDLGPRVLPPPASGDDW